MSSCFAVRVEVGVMFLDDCVRGGGILGDGVGFG